MTFDSRAEEFSSQAGMESAPGRTISRSIFGLSASEAVRLVDRLGNDAEFHASFSRDPVKALESMGLDPSMAKCFEGKALAPMPAIRSAAGQAVNLLASTATLAQSVHILRV